MAIPKFQSFYLFYNRIITLFLGESRVALAGKEPGFR